MSALVDKSYERNLTVKGDNTESSKTNIPRKGIARCLSPNFHNHASVSDLYIPTIGLPILLQKNMWTDPENISKSLTDTYECRSWDRSRAIPFLGIYIRNFRSRAFVRQNLRLEGLYHILCSRRNFMAVPL